MLNSGGQFEIPLSIVVTVVSGKEALRRCLEELCPQVDSSEAEVIVPYDKWSPGVGSLVGDFPWTRFHFIDDLGVASPDKVSSHEHRLYDRRRAVGLSLARGRVIAMTEDHAVPSADWCSRILAAHGRPYAVIGGVIDNMVDRPLNWALYYCDFGRYGSPLPGGEAEYVSDVNVAYKRRALDSIRHVWRDAYHETTVHWSLRSGGETIFFDPSMVVRQRRPPVTFRRAYRERIEWGRVFAETRVAACGAWRRALYAAGTPLLPALLSMRVLRHMRRQQRTVRQMIGTLPLAICLLTGWALGELAGYLAGRACDETSELRAAPQAGRAERC